MYGQESQLEISSPSISAATSTSTPPSSTSHRHRILQNYVLIWLDTNFDESKKDYQYVLVQLQNIVHDVYIFAQWDEAIDFVTDHEDIKTIFLTTANISLHILTVINDIQQIDSFYILFSKKSQYEAWTTKSKKFKGVYTNIQSICQELQPTIKQYNQNSISMSFLPTNEGTSERNLNQLEATFMYTQIFKEILLEMKHDKKSIEVFISFWREHYNDNPVILKVIAEFERDYRPQSSIWWYTRESFIYQMLNQALRTLDSDTIINMGFFIHDLHKEIEQLHQKQVNNYGKKVFTVYRGQGLSKLDFDKLLKSKGGLLSFNNFLSTSTERSVSLFFAESAATKADTIGILFNITINVSLSAAPFASIQKMSHFEQEKEILFSMHTVFRIHDITKMYNDNTLYQVNLTLTDDEDEQLCTLTNTIRKEVAGATGWERLSTLLMKIGQVNKAEEFCVALLKQTFDQTEQSRYLNHLGYIKHEQGDYKKAIRYYENSIEIQQIALPPNHPDVAPSYNNIATVYDSMGEYPKALSFYEKSLEIRKKALSPNHPSLATTYNSIAGVYHNMGEYSKALSFYEKSLEIRQKVLPPNHPSLATSYNNIATVYYNMGEYPKALSFYEKSLEIQQKSLPPNHPLLAASYNNIAMVYHYMGEYSKALSFYEKSLEIRQKALPPDHPDVAISYNNIAGMYDNMGEYSKALSFYEKSLEIRQKTLPPNHPDVAASYNNIATVYDSMEEYPKALSFYEKSLEIQQKSLPPNHPSLAISYNNIAMVYSNIGKYSKALSFYEKSLEIRQKTLPPNHPSLATSYNNIAMVYDNMGEYSKALPYFERALNIFTSSLPSSHPNIEIVRQNLEMMKKKL